MICMNQVLGQSILSAINTFIAFKTTATKLQLHVLLKWNLIKHYFKKCNQQLRFSYFCLIHDVGLLSKNMV